VAKKVATKKTAVRKTALKAADVVRVAKKATSPKTERLPEVPVQLFSNRAKWSLLRVIPGDGPLGEGVPASGMPCTTG
jgi:hypothetical protein